MKDKLEKTGHKKGYYMRRGFLKGLALSFALLTVAAILIGISYKVSVAKIDEPKAAKHVEETKKQQQEESLQKHLSKNNIRSPFSKKTSIFCMGAFFVLECASVSRKKKINNPDLDRGPYRPLSFFSDFLII